MNHPPQKGFTLVEVVIVIAVVALLAAIIIPPIAKQLDAARIAVAKKDCQMIAAAINSSTRISEFGRHEVL